MQVIYPRKQVLTLWRIVLVIVSAVPAFAISFFLKGNIYKLAIIAWFILFLFLYLLYLPFYYKSLTYILYKDNLTVQRGVIFNNLYTLPLDKVQFTTLTINPLTRLVGLVSLRVVAPGAKLSLSGLSMKEARRLAHEISSLSKEAQGDE